MNDERVLARTIPIVDRFEWETGAGPSATEAASLNAPSHRLLRGRRRDYSGL